MGTLNWLPVSNPVSSFLAVGSPRNLLAEWGLFSGLESYIMFRLEGKTANFYVKDFGSKGFTMAIPRNTFEVERFDSDLRTLGGAVIADVIQVNKYKKKSYTVKFSHIPLRNLGS